MREVLNVKPLADAISKPIIDVYTAGGNGLVTVLLGTVLLLSGTALAPKTIGYLIAALGAVMIGIFLYFFYVRDVKQLRDIHRTISANSELINTVQLMAIEMTGLAYELQSLAFKHADDVAKLVTEFRAAAHGVEQIPFVANLPGIRAITAAADHPVMVRAEDFSAAIVRSTNTAKQIIEDVKTALVDSDPRLLKKYLDDVRELEEGTRRLLSSTQEAARLTGPKLQSG